MFPVKNGGCLIGRTGKPLKREGLTIQAMRPRWRIIVARIRRIFTRPQFNNVTANGWIDQRAITGNAQNNICLRRFGGTEIAV